MLELVGLTRVVNEHLADKPKFWTIDSQESTPIITTLSCRCKYTKDSGILWLLYRMSLPFAETYR